MAMLADDDLNARADTASKIDDGKTARKFAPVLEEEPTNYKETNAHEAKKRAAESDDEQSNKKKKVDDDETNKDDPNKEIIDKDRDQTKQ
jgi:hypothetical protein